MAVNVNLGTDKVVITDNKERKILPTTIPCLEGTMFEGDCCGCLTGWWDELEKIWIFRCNECEKEWGRGTDDVWKAV